MYNLYKRFFGFLVLCLGTRSLIVYASYKATPQQLMYMGIFSVIMAVAWIRIYFFAPRTTGPEVFGGYIWWNDLRIIHALLYLLFAFYAFQGKNYGWRVLAIDVIIGLIAFLCYHHRSGNFSRLLH